MDIIDVSSIEIRDYAQSFGWQLVREALEDGLFVLSSPDKDKGDYTQLVFPKDTSVSDYAEMAATSLKRLAEFYSKRLPELIDEIREVNDDVISLRYYSEGKIVNSISFEEAYEAISATRQMILSAASTVINPTIYHRKLNRTEPQDLIKKTKFRHTQEGSFILKVSVPFERTHVSNASFDNISGDSSNEPIGRKAVEVISLASSKIIESVDLNNISELFENQSRSDNPILSYNFCDALLKVFDEERELPFELIFNWSRASLRDFPIPSVPKRVNFPFAYRAKIEELKDCFAPIRGEISDTFYGTVESLNGDVGPDERRSGEVTFALLIDTDLVKARANLSVEHYQTAIQAHSQGGAYIMIKGRLNRQNRIGVIREIGDFRLAGG